MARQNEQAADRQGAVSFTARSDYSAASPRLVEL